MSYTQHFLDCNIVIMLHLKKIVVLTQVLLDPCKTKKIKVVVLKCEVIPTIIKKTVHMLLCSVNICKVFMLSDL